MSEQRSSSMWTDQEKAQLDLEIKEWEEGEMERQKEIRLGYTTFLPCSNLQRQVEIERRFNRKYVLSMSYVLEDPRSTKILQYESDTLTIRQYLYSTTGLKEQGPAILKSILPELTRHNLVNWLEFLKPFHVGEAEVYSINYKTNASIISVLGIS